MLTNIINHIKQKKELTNLDNNLIKEKINHFLKNNKRINDIINNSRSFDQLKRNKHYKEFVKKIRKEFREIYGVFILAGYKNIDNYLKELEKAKNRTEKEKIINKILLLHQSSKERLSQYGEMCREIYGEIYKEIFSTIKPKSILDLGCGLNPFSYIFIPNYKKIKFIASDLNEKDLLPIKEFFKLEKIEGKTVPFDIIKDYKKLKKFKTDVCFLLKLLDSLETTKRNITREIIKNINSKYIIASFSTMSLGGKKEIKKERRTWFEKILKNNNYSYTTFEIENELFYIVKKEKLFL